MAGRSMIEALVDLLAARALELGEENEHLRRRVHVLEASHVSRTQVGELVAAAIEARVEDLRRVVRPARLIDSEVIVRALRSVS
jgi:hypothetical protein